MSEPTRLPSPAEQRRYPDFRVSWSEQEGKYRATCEDYPELSALEYDPTDALDNLRYAIDHAD